MGTIASAITGNTVYVSEDENGETFLRDAVTGKKTYKLNGFGSTPITPVVTLTGTTISEAGKIYLYTPTDGDVLTFFTPQSGVDNAFELDVIQGETAASFTLPTVTWTYGIPDLSAANTTTRIKFRYISGAWQAWSEPRMSDYVRNGSNPNLSINVSDGGYSEKVLYTTRSGNRFNIVMSQTGTSSGPGSITLNSMMINLNPYGSLRFRNKDHNTSGGICISDETTGNITSPGDVIATINGTTVSMSSLLARIEALENA